MMATLRFVAPLFMAGAAATAIAAAPVAAAESFAVAAGSSLTQFAQDDPGGNACTPNGDCGTGGPWGGQGCTASGACGSGGPWGGQGCVPGVGCFHWP